MKPGTCIEPRSMLFVPADAERFMAKATTRGADVIVLDLEDGVAPSSKDAARIALSTTAPMLRSFGAVVYVRVNNEPGVLQRDLESLVSLDVQGIVMPKVDAPEQLSWLEQWASACNLSAAVGFVGLIESPVGVCAAPEIARSATRLRGLCFGSEDFSAAMGVDPAPESLAWPANAVAVAAVAAGVQPLGLVGSVANFTDISSYRELVVRSKRMGMRGATCIHPAQVKVLNEVFDASDADVERSEALLSAFDEAVRAGKGAISVNGRMVDEPVAQRARLLLERHRARHPDTLAASGG